MTIAELLIKIGVKVDGAEKLKRAETDLKSAGKTGAAAAVSLEKVPPALKNIGKGATTHLRDLESWATRTAFKLDVLSAAMLYMVDTALKAGGALQKFGFLTGIPGQGLLGAQGRGVGAGIGPDEMQQFVTNLQSQGAKMRLTGEGVGPWGLLSMLLGIPVNPTEDPLKLIDKLHQGLMRLQPDQLAYARTVAGQIGMPENIFAGLRNPRFDIERFKEIYSIVAKNAAGMGDLNNEWKALLFNLGETKNALVSEFRPEIEMTIKALGTLVRWVANFVEWLDKGSAGATAVKVVIGGLALAIPLAAVALTGLATALGTLAIATVAADLGLAPILATVLAISAAAGLAAAAISGLGMGNKANYGKGGSSFGGFGYAFGNWLSNNPSSGASGTGGNTTINHNVTIPVNGAADPSVTAQRVGNVLKQQLNAAAYSAPAPSR